MAPPPGHLRQGRRRWAERRFLVQRLFVLAQAIPSPAVFPPNGGHTDDLPPESGIGSSIQVRFERRDGQLVPVAATRDPGVLRRPDEACEHPEPRRPAADRRVQRLRWQPGHAAVHHTAAQRQWAYDRGSVVGRLEQALDEAKARGWTAEDMRRDRLVLFPRPR